MHGIEIVIALGCDFRNHCEIICSKWSQQLRRYCLPNGVDPTSEVHQFIKVPYNIILDRH